jgi:REP-associated tyrosine transposase
MRTRPYTYLVTTVTAGRRRLFQRATNAELLIDTLFRYRDQGRFLLHGYIVMPEHLHALLTPAHDIFLERCMQFIKGGFSHAVRPSFSGEIWQRGFNEQSARDENTFEQFLRYIEKNATDPCYAYMHRTAQKPLDAMPCCLRG